MSASRPTLFVADLHLSPERPRLIELFLAFLEERAAAARALYILGDLFEAWLGDDLILPGYEPVLTGLRGVADAGVPVYLLHGNRDFLLGEEFARRTGGTLLAEPHRLELNGAATLLLHGDSLCTDDRPYQALRRMLRDPAWIADFLAKPPQERIALARQLREKSREEVSRKDYGIMDVNAEAVAATFREQAVIRLIHGHTHRPGLHELTVDGRAVQRMVLGDWSDDSGSVLVCAAGECRLEAYSGR